MKFALATEAILYFGTHPNFSMPTPAKADAPPLVLTCFCETKILHSHITLLVTLNLIERT